MSKTQNGKPKAPLTVRASRRQANVDVSKYEVDFGRKAPNLSSQGVKTTAEIVALLEKDPSIDVDALVMYVGKDGTYRHKRLRRQEFLEAFKKTPDTARLPSKLKESYDAFAMDGAAGATGIVADDYVPILGGPFHKNLYMQDFLRAFAEAFHAYNHDPVARFIINTVRDFTLGRGFRVDCKDPKALAYWRAFEQANELHVLLDFIERELSLYGETMIWWLPNMQTKTAYNFHKPEDIPTGALPRIRLIDPSTCWEVITWPEDITKVIAYQLVFPTQYQIYTAKDDKGELVPGSRFVVQQVPADQVLHYKVNTVSNEKRGRSDLYPVFGYLKRLRDIVNYSVIGAQKASAWSIDTTIEGSQEDVDAYVQSMEDLGTIPPAGMEFAHTDKVKRDYLSNQHVTHGGGDSAFEWCLNMIATGVGIPVSYFGTHLSGGGSRASALVATEPVAKRMERRQLELERIIKDLWKKLMETLGITGVECEVTFPEIIAQDRSSKLKDVKLCEDAGYITKKRAAEIAAKELNITDYDYDIEKDAIDSESEDEKPISPTLITPLTAPPKVDPAGTAPTPGGETKPENGKPSAVTQDERRSLSLGYGG